MRGPFNPLRTQPAKDEEIKEKEVPLGYIDLVMPCHVFSLHLSSPLSSSAPNSLNSLLIITYYRVFIKYCVFP